VKPAPIIFLVVLGAYALTAGGHLYSPDEEILYRMTRALATGPSLAIEPLGDFATRQGRDGRYYGQYGIGQPLLAVPFYWAGRAVAGLAGRSQWNRLYGPSGTAPHVVGEEPTAAAYATRWALSWFNILLGALLAVLLYGVCVETTGQREAAGAAALLYALGSLAWPHSRPFFTESCAAFFILLAWWALLRARRGRVVRWCAVAGAAAGYAALVRNDSVLAYPGLAILLLGPAAWGARAEGRPAWQAWAAFCAPALVCGVILLGMNVVLYGGPFESGYADQPEGLAFTTPVLAGLYGLLFSIGKGLFFFSPALALGFLGWRPLALAQTDQRRLMLWALAFVIAVPLVVHAKWQNWSGGWCWGPRHIFLIQPFLAIPIAAWLARPWGPPTRVILLVALIVGGTVQLLGASQDFIRFYRDHFRRSPHTFFVVYDDYDRMYWESFFQLYSRPEPDPRIPLQPVALYPPAPTQDSLYFPQRSVWAAYPRMIREEGIDNFWVRLAGLGARPRASDAPETRIQP